MAGWWLWGISNWISVSDFCRAAFVDTAPPDDDDIPDRTQLRNGKGVQQGRMTTPAGDAPSVTYWRNGQGVQAHRMTDPGDALLAPGRDGRGQGVQAHRAVTPVGKIPHRKNDGSGQALQLGAATTPARDGGGIGTIPHIKNDHTGQGMQQRKMVTPVKPPKTGIETGAGGVSTHRVSPPQAIPAADPRDRWAPWFRWLAQRLAGVTILNTPWQTVLGSRTLLGDFENRTIGIFLDPPYPNDRRSANLYALDNGDDIFPAVWQWAKDHGDRPNFRIAICGLDGHFSDIPDGWRVYRWRNAGMRSKARPDELVLFSPYCLGEGGATQPELL